MNKSYVAPGPVFEPGPGWGEKLKKWSKKYILGGNCALCRATRYVVVFGIVFLAIAWPKLNTPPSVREESKIVETVRHKDGKTHLARRGLVQYLEQNPEIKITKAQKVFIETSLREKILGELTLGNTVEITTKEVEQAVEQAKLLTPLQLKKWEFYAEAVDL